MNARTSSPIVAIACGGTGGHLFPGVAVAEALKKRGCSPHLLISPKEVDQTAVKSAVGMTVSTLPAVGLTNRSRIAFVKGFFQSWLAARKVFRTARPDAVLAMGGFTSAPPIFAARGLKVPTFIHESNTIPGRANRWLSRFVDCAFVGFPESANHLKRCTVKQTGTPVREAFRKTSVTASRETLGLNADQPVMIVTGGSQGASGLNDLVIAALPYLAKRLPGLQSIHLTGPSDVEKTKQAYAANGIKAVVHPFFADMPLVLNAADVCISRAGASSLAELAAMRLTSILVPFPAAMDNHQFFNANAYQNTGAAILMEQKTVNPAELAESIISLLTDTVRATAMREALAQWHFPDAADRIAENILQAIAEANKVSGKNSTIDARSASIRDRQTATT